MKSNNTEKAYRALGQWVSKHHKISYGARDNIRLSGANTSRKAFQSFFASSIDSLDTFLSGEDLQAYKNLRIDMIDDLRCHPAKAEAEIASRLFVKLQAHLEDVRREEVGISRDGAILGSIQFQSYVAIRDAISPHTYMMNKKTGRIKRDFDYDQWKKQLRESPLDAKSKGEVLGEQILGIVEYNPSDPRDNYRDEWDGVPDIFHANSHITPDWRREKAIEAPKLPKEFVELLNHLFVKDVESIQYVLFWLYTMLTSRNQTYLHLIGGKGVGKGSFFRIARRLVGVDNYVTIDLSFWSNKFNSELKDRRLCYFDEHDIDESNLSQLKLYANDEIPIQEKHIPTKGNYTNFASLAISNNPKDAVNRIEYQDRRFSIPLCRQEGDIAKELGIEWEEALRHKTEKDPSFIKSIGDYILYLGDSGKFSPEFSPGKAFKSDLFYETVEKNLYSWQFIVVDFIVRKGEEVAMSTVRDSVCKQGTSKLSSKKVSEFLKYHLDRDGDKLGYIKYKGKIENLVPFDKYLKDKKEKKEKSSTSYKEMGF